MLTHSMTLVSHPKGLLLLLVVLLLMLLLLLLVMMLLLLLVMMLMLLLMVMVMLLLTSVLHPTHGVGPAAETWDGPIFQCRCIWLLASSLP
jgi:hypothetical protein